MYRQTVQGVHLVDALRESSGSEVYWVARGVKPAALVAAGAEADLRALGALSAELGSIRVGQETLLFHRAAIRRFSALSRRILGKAAWDPRQVLTGQPPSQGALIGLALGYYPPDVLAFAQYMASALDEGRTESEPLWLIGPGICFRTFHPMAAKAWVETVYGEAWRRHQEHARVTIWRGVDRLLIPAHPLAEGH